MRKEIEATLGKLIVWALVLVALLVTPWWSIDPINPIKMAALSAIAFMGLAVLVVNFRAIEIKRYKIPGILIVGFMLWLIVVFAASGGEKMQQLFGSNGRNTGLITYVAFSILFMISVVASTSEFLPKFLRAGLIVGIASLAYGLIQIFDYDPIQWVNLYSPVFGFLGNPNFQSSLLGILGVVVFTQLLSSAVSGRVKAAYMLYLLVTAYVIYETDSQQGFLVLLAGCALSLGIFVALKNRLLGLIYMSLGGVGFVAVFLGIMNKGALASVLYKESVTYRGDYWRAGWKMTMENPIVGIGLDSYGDWYRRSRTIEATLRRGPDVTSNAAHNVYLDISSYGGLPLLFAYLALMTLVVVSAIKVLKRNKGFNAGFVGLVSGWVAFQAQSIISINQIGLAIWGWVLSGLIIGYEIHTRDGEEVIEKRAGKKSIKPVQSSAGTALALFIGLLIGALVGVPPYMASAKFKAALGSSNPVAVQNAAYIWPVEPARMIQVSRILYENKLETEGLKVAIDATMRFPNNYGVWASLMLMDKATAEQKAEATAQMKRLDPLNPNLK